MYSSGGHFADARQQMYLWKYQYASTTFKEVPVPNRTRTVLGVSDTYREIKRNAVEPRLFSNNEI